MMKQRGSRAAVSCRFCGIFLAYCLIPAVFGQSSHSPARHRSKFEPPRGKTILFIGQARGEIEAYRRDAGTGAPPGYMLYTSLGRLEGLEEPFIGSGCMEAGTQDLQGLAREFPGSAAQIGLYIGGQLEKITSGQMDDQIRKLAEVLRDIRRPVFLRIGYEFDGPWNSYDPGPYRQAFRRIVTIFRGINIGGRAIAPVTNVAFIWHSAAWKTYQSHPIEFWYPGDQYVDWVGVSWFAWKTKEEDRIAVDARDKVLSFAKKHRKPLMIAESAPKKYFLPSGPGSWAEWYSSLFQWIRDNEILGFSYINQNWETQTMWGNPECKTGMDWGDSRVQVGESKVLSQWQGEISRSRFLKPGDQLFRAIGFSTGEKH